MKIPKDYIAIPINKYEEILKQNIEMSERLETLATYVETEYVIDQQKGLAGMIFCRDLAALLRIDLPEVNGDLQEDDLK